MAHNPERRLEVPGSSFDRWLVSALVAAGLFGVFGFALDHTIRALRAPFS